MILVFIVCESSVKLKHISWFYSEISRKCAMIKSLNIGLRAWLSNKSQYKRHQFYRHVGLKWGNSSIFVQFAIRLSFVLKVLYSQAQTYSVFKRYLALYSKAKNLTRLKLRENERDVKRKRVRSLVKNWWSYGLLTYDQHILFRVISEKKHILQYHKS